MAIITFLIFTEKSLALGQQIAKIAAIVLIVYGALVVFVPCMLPMMILARGKNIKTH
jgi:hypothetical protein